MQWCQPDIVFLKSPLHLEKHDGQIGRGHETLGHMADGVKPRTALRKSCLYNAEESLYSENRSMKNVSQARESTDHTQPARDTRVLVDAAVGNVVPVGKCDGRCGTGAEQRRN